jgi:hypothetical protein
MSPYELAEIHLKQAHTEHTELWELAFTLVSVALKSPEAVKLPNEGWDAFMSLVAELRRTNPHAFDDLADRISSRGSEA